MVDELFGLVVEDVDEVFYFAGGGWSDVSVFSLDLLSTVLFKELYLLHLLLFRRTLTLQIFIDIVAYFIQKSMISTVFFSPALVQCLDLLRVALTLGLLGGRLILLLMSFLAKLRRQQINQVFVVFSLVLGFLDM